MRTTKSRTPIRQGLMTAGLLAATLTLPVCSQAQDAAQTSPPDAAAIGADAYVYGYSLLTTEITRVQMSNVDKVQGLHAPMGQFVNVPRYPPAEFRAVSAPNADTLYSLTWVDLSEPQVFSHPDMGDRFYLFEMTNLWMTDFETPGKRTQGGAAANYLLTGPGWTGAVPPGMTQIKSATRYMVILGRTYADGSGPDYAKVNALQAQYTITPLSAWGQSYTPKAPAVDANPGYSMTDSPQIVIDKMDASAYFNMMARLTCKDAPPAAEDAPILAKMATIGLEPCKTFDMSKLDAATQAALNDSIKAGWKRIADNQKNLGHQANGWTITTGLGVYGTDYTKRAVVAAFGWPANLQADAVYPFTTTDSGGAMLTGANNYTLTFAKGQTPPAKGFWSITMYEVEPDGWWFTPNALNKFTVSPRDGLKSNADGSVTLYFQKASPGSDKQANWLPAPTGQFIPMLRMYWPSDTDPSIINGSWTPPPVMKAGS